MTEITMDKANGLKRINKAPKKKRLCLEERVLKGPNYRIFMKVKEFHPVAYWSMKIGIRAVITTTIVVVIAVQREIFIWATAADHFTAQNVSNNVGRDAARWAICIVDMIIPLCLLGHFLYKKWKKIWTESKYPTYPEEDREIPSSAWD